MKITTIDKGTAEAITSRLHDAVRDVADSMGLRFTSRGRNFLLSKCR